MRPYRHCGRCYNRRTICHCCSVPRHIKLADCPELKRKQVSVDAPLEVAAPKKDKDLSIFQLVEALQQYKKSSSSTPRATVSRTPIYPGSPVREAHRGRP